MKEPQSAFRSVTSGISSMPSLLNSAMSCLFNSQLSFAQAPQLSFPLFKQQAASMHSPPNGLPFVALQPPQVSFNSHLPQSRPHIDFAIVNPPFCFLHVRRVSCLYKLNYYSYIFPTEIFIYLLMLYCLLTGEIFDFQYSSNYYLRHRTLRQERITLVVRLNRLCFVFAKRQFFLH
ncbi:hypothetical protein SDC9_101763 [bioreactor metagenome]|uniref:Uncharacterized protein n=1 Tax=bioreactor metagenome TaxID=1076179 RepID=A0A645APG2_9ZZZZ